MRCKSPSEAVRRAKADKMDGFLLHSDHVGDILSYVIMNGTDTLIFP